MYITYVFCSNANIEQMYSQYTTVPGFETEFYAQSPLLTSTFHCLSVSTFSSVSEFLGAERYVRSAEYHSDCPMHVGTLPG